MASRSSKCSQDPVAGGGASAPVSAVQVPMEDDVVDAMGRKVWNKDYFMEKAKNNIMFGPERIGRRKDPVIPLPSSQRTFLKQRNIDLDLEKDIGKSRVVTQHTIKPLQGGYWCSVCECLLKDSSAYLEHVNGRRHNRNLGMNMKVEKIGVDRVREKLKAMRKEPEAVESDDITKRIEAMEALEQERKRRKKDKKRKKKKGGGGEAYESDEEDDATGDEKPDREEPEAKRIKGKVAEGEEEDEDDDDEDEETEEMRVLKSMGLPTGFG
eukprot:TRINITY_DN16395_c0_g1_i2.p1 TRINITY_DN16395_c0_g1~~TRINITY_DN16395_c0_g1_i2.p1  ORF type:complete len:315 (-),score=91.25 TRINITY_DN16395_c0_g1_i2:72-875(-)